ncbi:MAG: HAD family hydrolase [Clostridia bacterium]|nr:HAD family hydrolase [Clostridia bacterium]
MDNETLCGNEYDFGRVKLIATDMDGTFITTGARIPEENRRAARICDESGVTFVIASGRSYRSLGDFIGVEGKNGYIIAHNGARIATAGAEKELYRMPLSMEDAKFLLDLGNRLRVTACVWADEDLYISRRTRNGEIYAQAALAKTVYFDAEDPFFLRDIGDNRSNIDKIYWTANEDGTGWKSNEVAKMIPKTLSCFTSGGGCMEFVDRNVSKGAALKKLCDIIGIDPRDTVAFGDSENDISLLEASGFGVAMENADIRVKAAAKYITKTNNDCGVASAIEEFFGSRQLRKDYGL